uniref:ShKT domain-containing protein n=1 Tax=Trichuris muris TaxID=70415 RepID=A0A5S6QGN7_TRIMR
MMLPFSSISCIVIPFLFALDTVAGHGDQKYMDQIREVVSRHPSQCLSPLGKAWFFTTDGTCGKISCKPPFTLCTVSYIARGSQELHYQCTNVPARCLALIRQARLSGNRRYDHPTSPKHVNANGGALAAANPEGAQDGASCEDDSSQGSSTAVASFGGTPFLGPIYILPISGCSNGHEKCCDWASKGECNKNPVMMKTLCKQACGTCGCRAEEVMLCQPAVNLISCKPPKKGSCKPKETVVTPEAPEEVEYPTVETEQPGEAVEPEVTGQAVLPTEAEATKEPIPEETAPPEAAGVEEPSAETHPAEVEVPGETWPPEIVTEAVEPVTTVEVDSISEAETPATEAPIEPEQPAEVVTEAHEDTASEFPEEIITEAPGEVETVAPSETYTEAPAVQPAEVETQSPVELSTEAPAAECETEAPPMTELQKTTGAEVLETEHEDNVQPSVIPEVTEEIFTEPSPAETDNGQPIGPEGPASEVAEEVTPETTPQPPGTSAPRPLGEVTYGPPAYPTSTCPDAVVTCAFWANKGECDKNPYWMKPNCQKSCNSCGSTVGSINKPQSKPGCDNQHELCQFWKSIGECASNMNYMASKCPLSCESCGKRPLFPVGPSAGMGYGG